MLGFDDAWYFRLLSRLASMAVIWAMFTLLYMVIPNARVRLGSALMAGAFLAIGACLSATTRNQVIAFILTVVVCFTLLLAGFPLVLEFIGALFPQGVVDAVASLSFLTHFAAIAKGVVDLRDVLFFLLVIAFWLAACALVIDLKKAD